MDQIFQTRDIQTISEYVCKNMSMNLLKQLHCTLPDLETQILRECILLCNEKIVSDDYNILLYKNCIFSPQRFINFVINTTKPLSMILGASNTGTDKERFEDIFDFAMSNSEYSIECGNLNVLHTNFDDISSLRIVPIIRNEGITTLKTEKFKLIVVDWSTIKFIPAKLIILFLLYYLDVDGEFYTEVTTYSDKLVIDDKNLEYILTDDNKLKFSNIGRNFLNVGIIHKLGYPLYIEDIVDNNKKYLEMMLNKFSPETFTIEYINDYTQYPNRYLETKKVHHFFKITKHKKCKFDITTFRNLNVYYISN